MLLKLGKRRSEYIQGISEAADRYDAFLLDIWGVLHNGARPYPGVIDCLYRLQTRKKKVILLSNTARRIHVLEQQLLGLGFLPDMYNHLLSSGELAWSIFSSRMDERLEQLGKTYFLLGSEQYGMTKGLTLQAAESLDDANFILTIGVSGNPSTTAAAEEILQRGAAKGLVMVCVNPDRQVVRDGVMGIGPGALAARYEELGGTALYFGKPHRAIYRMCMDMLGEINRSRIVAVGDSLSTDVAGAGASCLDSILITGGIHAEELSGLPDSTQPLAALCEEKGHYPTLTAKGFFW